MGSGEAGGGAGESGGAVGVIMDNGARSLPVTFSFPLILLMKIALFLITFFLISFSFSERIRY